MSDITTAFNERIPMPPLLAEFETWVTQFEYGQLGYFEFSAEHLDDNWIEQGGQLANQFALWLCLGDGSMIGFWRPDDFADDDVLPVVLLGSEGEVEVLGESLEDFLYRWADGGQLGGAYDLMPEYDEDVDTEFKHDALLAWLLEKGVQKPVITKPVTTQSLSDFFDAWQAQHVQKRPRYLP